MEYTKTEILGIQLRSMMLGKMTRAELWNKLQLVRNLEPVTDAAYRFVEEKRWREALDSDDNFGDKWHVAFHGSQFPNGDKACPRQALYRMMDFPSSGPFSRRSRVLMQSGKDGELELVRTYQEAGILLSAGPDEEFQTGFELAEAWLISSVDCVILAPGQTKPWVVEIKQKGKKDLDEMLLGRGPDPAHISQIKVQIAFVALYQKMGLWLADLDPITHGFIYYMSRDDPTVTAEFRVDLDEQFFKHGVETLKRWRTYFDEDLLPELDPGKRSSKFGHPNGWRWSKLPCAWCDFKQTCQLDFRDGTTQLSNSNGINRAKLVMKDYDPEAARLRVRARWQKRKQENKDQIQSGS